MHSANESLIKRLIKATGVDPTLGDTRALEEIVTRLETFTIPTEKGVLSMLEDCFLDRRQSKERIQALEDTRDLLLSELDGICQKRWVLGWLIEFKYPYTLAKLAYNKDALTDQISSQITE